MASRILLISNNRCATPDVVFPLGLAHLNATLRHAGHETRWLDFNLESQALPEVLREFQPQFIGVSVRNIDDVLIRKRETYFNQLGDLCGSVRQIHPCPIILGGSGFSIFPQRLLALTGADFGIQGEGERGFLALIAALSSGGDFSNVPGLVYRRGLEIIANPQSMASLALALEPTDRPSPVFDYYLRQSGMLNLQTQRGCAHTCCYCTYPVIEGRVHRQRPPELVAEELAQLEARGAKYVFIVDSIFNSSPRHVVQTCEAILQKNLSIRWGCFMRPQGLTPALVDLMARAGLSHIEFGSDSFCDNVLSAYRKHFTFDDILLSSELARQRRLDFCHFLICGGPGETDETLTQTFDQSLKLHDAVIMAVVGMRIYPGTALHERALHEQCITPDADLLTPTYYLAPGLTEEHIFRRIEEFARRAPNWIAGDATPAYTRLVERLRSRGVAGPLWSYFAMVRRLAPAFAPEATT